MWISSKGRTSIAIWTVQTGVCRNFTQILLNVFLLIAIPSIVYTPYSKQYNKQHRLSTPISVIFHQTIAANTPKPCRAPVLSSPHTGAADGDALRAAAVCRTVERRRRPRALGERNTLRTVCCCELHHRYHHEDVLTPQDKKVPSYG